MRVGDIIKDTYEFWGNPSEQELPQNHIITIINRKTNRLLLLSQLTDKNYLAILSDPFSLPEEGATLDFTDIGTINRVDSRSVGSNTWNYDETIVDYADWQSAVDGYIDSVSFAANPTDGLMMFANRDTTSLEFRLLYETPGVSLTQFNSSIPMLQDMFRQTLFYGVAAEAGIQIQGGNRDDEYHREKRVRYLLAQEVDAIKEFQEWLRNQPGQAVAYREPFNSTRPGHGVRMHAADYGGGYYETWDV
jgi:hypothetical protein